MCIVDNPYREGRRLGEGPLEGITLFLGVAPMGANSEGSDITPDVTVHQVQ
ncbi:hypothetical protein QE394_001768 [Arthrobacter sp. SORGH_AS 212]|uniref:hypothetical protein n=1 Tax=Pseudarthrobacter sp. SORGH_AS 212 TaxID=3041777 RepID=UPI002782F1CB|nr:hypothetical protein [Arthrobacter sp. SORGH_AS_0212]